MNNLDTRLLSIEQAQSMFFKGSDVNTGTVSDGNTSFAEVFTDKIHELDSIRFSKHANARLESRNINLSKEQLDRLNDGVERARTKNINESLVMMDNLAFIVNIKNNTVVTAMDNNQDSVFTNIDGAVIV